VLRGRVVRITVNERERSALNRRDPVATQIRRRRCRHAGIENYFALESGGQSLATCIGFSPLCTVGAAELEPPASGRIALFSTAIEFDVFSSPWPEVAAVQLVSGFCPVVAGCAMAPPVSEAASTAAAIPLKQADTSWLTTALPFRSDARCSYCD
jgi:hypothetical protein